MNLRPHERDRSQKGQVPVEENLITPQMGWWNLNLKESWQHRDLFWLLAWRNIFVRNRPMLLGFLWTLLEPLAMLLVMIAVFGFILT